MVKKRANGEGSIRQRKDGTWESRVSVNGKRLSLYGKTQAEVRKKKTEMQAGIDNGACVAPVKITVAEWMKQWQEVFCPNIKRSTAIRYEADVRLHVLPAIGNMRLSAVKTSTIQRLYNEAHRQGLSDKSVRNLHGTLHKAMEKAVRERLISKNPCEGIELPRSDAPKKEMRPLKDNELPVFLKQIAGNKMEDLFYVAVFTGMRESELIGLSWDCIDFEHGDIHVYRQLTKGRKKGDSWMFTSLKNRQARTFRPAKDVMDVLRSVKRQQAEWRLKCGESWQDTDLVFTNEVGQHLSMCAIYSHFKSVVKAMGIPDVRFHDLRHTFATLSLQNGVDYKTLSVALGHATVAFTMDRYGHVTDTMMQNSASRMQAYIESIR